MKEWSMLDLRTMERFEIFVMFKIMYKTTVDMQVNVTTHLTRTSNEEKKGVMTAWLMDGLADLHNRRIPPYAIIRMYVKCEGWKQILCLMVQDQTD